MKWMYEHALARAQEFGIQASPAAHQLHSIFAIVLCASAFVAIHHVQQHRCAPCHFAAAACQ